MKINVIMKKGNNALLVAENADVASRDEYVLTCALNYQNYMGMVLYDVNESVKFKVSKQAPKEIKDKLLELAKEYFESL